MNTEVYDDLMDLDEKERLEYEDWLDELFFNNETDGVD